MSELRSLDRAFQNTRVWLNDVAAELQWVNERRVYTALRTVLHALRDRLTLPEAVQFGAQLPVFIRGLYYEGWRPGARPLRNRSKEAFLDEIRETFLKNRMSGANSEYAVRAVLRFLNGKITGGELSDVRGQLPKAVRSLWPDGPSGKAA